MKLECGRQIFEKISNIKIQPRAEKLSLYAFNFMFFYHISNTKGRRISRHNFKNSLYCAQVGGKRSLIRGALAFYNGIVITEEKRSISVIVSAFRSYGRVISLLLPRGRSVHTPQTEIIWLPPRLALYCITFRSQKNLFVIHRLLYDVITMT